MDDRKIISVLIGTRPEAVKLAPVINLLKKSDDFKCNVCVTGQHKEMLDQVLSFFEITPDHNLSLMKSNQSLEELTSAAITSISGYFDTVKPDLTIIQGDTTTVLCGAIASFYKRIPVAHIEAGLRTGEKYSPYPEEINRVLTSRITDIHLAPTEIARQNLLNEGISTNKVFVTGNTVIDALLLAVEKVKKNPPFINGLPQHLQPNSVKANSNKIVLITGHRRENFGEGFRQICLAISELATSFPEVIFVYPVHLNPNVQKPVDEILGKVKQKNIFLLEPLPYDSFISLMDASHIILTDSGGVQEEAPSLGKPVLVMRKSTERPEAVTAGTVKIVGTDRSKIVNAASDLLTDKEMYGSMAKAHNPYGDGTASLKILDILQDANNI